MKNYFVDLCVAACAMSMLLVSCEPYDTEIIVANPVVSVEVNRPSSDFYAYINDDFTNDSSTRTEISTSAGSDGKYSLSWLAGDEIAISDGSTTAVYTATASSKTATFVKKSGSVSNTATKYSAFYPSTITPSSKNLPATQEYVYGNVKNFPMYAESSDHNLEFKNLCGILRLSLKNTDSDRDIAVKSISVSVSGKGLSGNFTIDSSKAAVVSGTDGVVLNCASPVTLGYVEKDFNIVVPKGIYSAMKIKITTDDGKVVNLEGQSAVTVYRSGITKVSVALKSSSFASGLEVITFTDSDVDFSER